jgi:hypothetical protein
LKGLIRGTADKLKDSRVHCSADTCRDGMGGIKGQTGVLGQSQIHAELRKIAELRIPTAIAKNNAAKSHLWHKTTHTFASSVTINKN